MKKLVAALKLLARMVLEEISYFLRHYNEIEYGEKQEEKEKKAKVLNG